VIRTIFAPGVFSAAVLSCLFGATLRGADIDPPGVKSVSPVPGDVLPVFDQVTVSFSEPVTGVQAGDFLINEVPATAVTGAGDTWTFLFNQPSPGPVKLRWDLNLILTDLAGNRLDPANPLNAWSYTLTDLVAPAPLSIRPTPGAAVASLSQVEVTFSEAVDGVDAGDLLVNGIAASAVSGSGAGPYLFSLPAVAGPQVTLAWKSGNAIRDLSPAANPLVGSSWSYTLDPGVGSAGVVINEVLTDNLAGIADEDGATPDWIELLNRGATPVNLLGWSLSDSTSEGGRWTFPSITLQPGQYLVVFASGKDRKPVSPGSKLHANFRLNSTGGSLGLFDPGLPARLVDGLAEYPPQRGDIAYGRTGDGPFGYLGTPTPGAPNSTAAVYSGFVEPPRASVASGFFDAPFSVALDSPTPGATLYYTLDGSVPTRDSLLYAGPLTIAGTEARAAVTLRVLAVKAGMLPSLVTTITYIFPEYVLSQPSKPAGYPATWISPGKNSTPGDYEMDPKITSDPVYRPMIREGLKSLPTISMVTDEKLLFEPAQGVYVRRDSANRQPVHVEMFFPDGSQGFSVDCGFEVQGGSSPTDAGSDWKSKNLSMRLVFSGDFGNTKLKYPLYPGGPVEEFDTLILDSALNMVWNHMTDADQRYRAQYAREQFVNELLMRTTSQPTRGRFVLLYVNGMFWGMKDLHERPEEKWAASYWGGDPSDYDVLKHDSGTIIAGNATAYNTMLTAVRKPQSNITNYLAAVQHLDLDWFIDYMMVNQWAGNTDWDNHNWYAIRSRKPGSPGWRYIGWDAEHTLKSVTEDVTGINNAGAPSEIFTALRGNPEFRLRWADHIQKHFFNGGIFYVHPDHIVWDPAHPEWNRPAALYMQVIDTIDPAIVCESARWGDVARPGQPYTRNVEWLHELQSLLFLTNSPANTTRYFPLRSSNVLATYKRLGLYPTNALPPTFAQHGGRVAPGYSLLMASNGPGTIYFTLDGTDPRVFRSGLVSPSAFAYAPDLPPALHLSGLVRARTLNGTNWSALNEARFEVGVEDCPVRFTEIMYNPPGGDAYEFLELQNVSGLEVDLTGWSVSGAGITFAPGTRIGPGAFMVLASGVDTNAWKLRYPGVRPGGFFTGNLSNGGERLALVSADGITRLSVTYDDEAGWPVAADGGGRSLEILNPQDDPDDPSNWQASALTGGSPGLPRPEVTASPVRLNEVLAQNTGSVPHEGTFPDYVELHNAGPAAVDLGGWSLSDNGNPRRYVFPAGTQIAAGGHLLVWCDTNLVTSGLHAGFGLDHQGDSVFLYDAGTTRVDAISWGLQVADASLGRVGDEWTLTLPTPGAPNAAAPLASQSSLWLNEALPNPVAGQEDWVELLNRDVAAPAALKDIAFRIGDRTVRYPHHAFLAPHSFLQLFADERPGSHHLDLKLPSAGPSLTLLDAAGDEVQRLDFPAVVSEGVSFGSYPDGTASQVAFPGSATPGAPNASPAPYAGPLVNEILAQNVNAVLSPMDTASGYIEFLNPQDIPLAAAGVVIEVNGGQDGRFVFPAATVLAPHARLVLWCDATLPASTQPGPSLYAGFALPVRGATLTLHDAAGAVRLLTYGLQVRDLSIGDLEDGSGRWTLLASPTPGAPNSSAAPLGSVASLRVNEWMARPTSGPDWFELYNGDALPVALEGLALTDSPSIAARAGAAVFGELNFVAGRGAVRLDADSNTPLGPGHLPFHLNADGDSLFLYDTRSHAADGVSPLLLDAVTFGRQESGVSEGRWPDGAATRDRFPDTASPGSPNWHPHPAVRLNEVGAQGVVPSLTGVELFNTGATAVDISGWFLSDDPAEPRKFFFPKRTILAPHGYLVVSSEVLQRTGFGVPFAIPQGAGTLLLSEADAAGMLTGFGSRADLQPVSPSVSMGWYDTCLGGRFLPLSAQTLGVTNAAPRVGPVVLNELRPGIGAGQGPASALAYVELLNTGSEAVSLGTAGASWRVAGTLGFEFAPGTVLPPRGLLLIVPFDPAADATTAAQFRSQLGIPADVSLAGPFSGKLDAPVPPVRLERLLPDGNREIMDAFEASLFPEPAAALVRRITLPGQDPVAWVPGAPSPGLPNAIPDPGASPFITLQPLSLTGHLGDSLKLKVAAAGGAPLFYQWLKDGVEVVDAVYPELVLADAGPVNTGSYRVRVWNSAGCVLSEVAQVTVPVPPQIVGQPQPQVVDPGKTGTLTVTATSLHPPLTYQWLFEGTEIPGATSDTLAVANAQLANEGFYTVRVTDANGSRLSLPARLSVKVRPVVVQGPAPSDLVVAIGSNATLTVSATGSLPMTFIWKRLKGTATTVLTNISLMSGTCSFTLPAARATDAGKYFVAITNIGGTTLPVNSPTSVVTVVTGPAITRQPASVTVNPGQPASFSVEATGDAPLTFQWMRNGLPIGGATANTFTLPSAGPNDAGGYSVAVSNRGATVVSDSARLVVLLPIRVDIALDSNQVVLHWPGVAGQAYRVDTTLDLASGAWTPVGAEVTLSSPAGVFATPWAPGDTARYFRLVLVAP
jgi:hypothetical protein